VDSQEGVLDSISEVRRERAAEEDLMDIDSVLKGVSNGSITASIDMKMEELMRRFPGFFELPLRQVAEKCMADIDFIWEWTDRADADGRFRTWKEMYVKDKPTEEPMQSPYRPKAATQRPKRNIRRRKSLR
jgi:hypothetical protein